MCRIHLLLPGLLGLAWVACAVLINPIGDFPLNDDWAYGLPVEVMLKERALRFTDWNSPALVAQAAWGALFCLPAGFSFTALRISTLTLGLVGLIGMYFLLRHLGAGRLSATFGASVVGFNPLYLLLSHSFMTDVPFLAVMISSILLIFRGMDLGRDGELIAGLALACLSIFIRQTGLFVLIGFLVAYPLRGGFGRRWALVAVVPAALSAALLRLFERYLLYIGEMPGTYNVKSYAIGAFVKDLVHMHLGALKVPSWVSFTMLLYVGLWALPYSLGLAPTMLGRLTAASRKAAWLTVAAVTAGATTLLALRGWLMPMVHNQFNDFGLGAMTLPGAPTGLPRPFWIGITALAVTGTALIILILGVLAREKWLAGRTTASHESWPWRVTFLLAVAALNLGAIACAYSDFYDRYSLVFVPLFLGLIAALGHRHDIVRRPLVEGLSSALMAVYLIFGVAATHDYLGWNRARWAAAAELHERWGVPEEAIDGGFEYNNLLDGRERLRNHVHRSNSMQAKKNPLVPYRLGFEPLAAHEVVNQVECRPWLPRGVRRVYSLRRLSTAAPEASPRRDIAK